MTKNIVVIYSGRFQPFHKGHYETYLNIGKKFGFKNLYIATSNKTDSDKSPFDFSEKKLIMTKIFNVPSNKIVQVKNPYGPSEILSQFDPDTTAYIAVVGEKDSQRLGGKYYLPLMTLNNLNSYKQNGYVYVSPTAANSISGTDVRQLLNVENDSHAKENFFKVYTKFDKTVFESIRRKLKKKTITENILLKIAFDSELKQMILLSDTKILKETFGWYDEAYFNKLNESIIYDIIENAEISNSDYINKFTNFCKKYLQLNTHPEIQLVNNSEFAEKNKTLGYYDLKNNVIKVCTKGRLLADIMRTIAHEMVHHKQRELGHKMDGSTGSKVENSANIIAAMLMRKFGEGHSKIFSEMTEMSYQTVKTIDAYADNLMGMDVDLGKQKDHFFARLNHERNVPQITDSELESFFERLAKKKDIFLKFLEKYRNEIVVKDIQTQINIPFMLAANKLIAKTIMRKKDFKTSNNASGGDFILHEASAQELERERNKLFSKALKMMPNSPAQLKIRAELDKITAQLKKLKNESVDEDLTLPINVGDTVLMGRFKNKKVKVKDIGKDEHGMPTINGKKAATFRTLPKDKLKENIESSLTDKYDVELDLYEQPDYIELSKIVVPEDLRGLGIGTKVMEDLIKYAKDNNKDIFTTPSNAFGGNKSKLEQFYKSFGFKPNSGKYRDFRSKESLKLSLTENVLLEGGAYGRISHPSDIEAKLTIGDLKKIVNQSLSGNLQSPKEKTDGQAIAVSWRNGKLIAARNKGHLLNSGEAALDSNELTTKFENRGALSDAFKLAIQDLDNAISQLSDEQKNDIFKNGKIFLNCEIIYPPATNVIPYDKSLIILHGTMECDDNGNIIHHTSEIKSLADILSNTQLNTFSIENSPNKEIPIDDALKSKIPSYIQKIQNFQNELGLSDSDSFENIDKNNLIKLEDIFLELGSDLLLLIPSSLISNQVNARKKMIDELNDLIDTIENSDDLKKIEKLEFQLNRLNKLGGFEKIVPIEGIVFSYNGQAYKLTGTFAPLNQIFGILKYSK